MRYRPAIASSAAALVILLGGGCATTGGASGAAATGARQVTPTPSAVRPIEAGQSATPSTTTNATASPRTGAAPLPLVVEHGSRTGHKVALTFDADMTPQMLARLNSGQAQSYANLKVIAILEDGRVPATFFITGMWAQHYPDVMSRLAGNPRFEFANHTWTHRAYTTNCYTLDPMPRAEMATEIHRTFDIVKSFGGRQTRYFRFPGLCYNAAALAAIAPENVIVIQGDVISGDPLATAWKPIVRAVLDHVQPGSIVVLHVTEDNAKMTDEALPPILEGLKAKGLEPVRLSELLAS